MQFTYGSYEIDTAQFPTATIDALIRRGISHVLGNEAASKVVSADPEKTLSDEARAAKKVEYQKELLASMIAGTLGVRDARGPRIDPLQNVANSIARREILDILRAKRLKAPKGEEKLKLGDQAFTMNELVARRLANPVEGTRIMREAQKHVSDLERKAKKAQVEADQAVL